MSKNKKPLALTLIHPNLIVSPRLETRFEDPWDQAKHEREHLDPVVIEPKEELNKIEVQSPIKGKISDDNELDYKQHRLEGNYDFHHLYRSYKSTPHAPLSLGLKYFIHRIENQQKYAGLSLDQQAKLDQAFLDHHQKGKAAEKNGHIQIEDLQKFFVNNPHLIKQLLEEKDRLHNTLRRVGAPIYKFNGRDHIILTRGLNTNHPTEEHALASYADIPNTGFGDFQHHRLVPLDNVWYSFDAGPKEATSEKFGNENEFLVSPHEVNRINIPSDHLIPRKFHSHGKDLHIPEAEDFSSNRNFARSKVADEPHLDPNASLDDIKLAINDPHPDRVAAGLRHPNLTKDLLKEAVSKWGNSVHPKVFESAVMNPNADAEVLDKVVESPAFSNEHLNALLQNRNLSSDSLRKIQSRLNLEEGSLWRLAPIGEHPNVAPILADLSDYALTKAIENPAVTEDHLRKALQTDGFIEKLANNVARLQKNPNISSKFISDVVDLIKDSRAEQLIGHPKLTSDSFMKIHERNPSLPITYPANFSDDQFRNLLKTSKGPVWDSGFFNKLTSSQIHELLDYSRTNSSPDSKFGTPAAKNWLNWVIKYNPNFKEEHFEKAVDLAKKTWLRSEPHENPSIKSLISHPDFTTDHFKKFGFHNESPQSHAELIGYGLEDKIPKENLLKLLDTHSDQVPKLFSFFSFDLGPEAFERMRKMAGTKAGSIIKLLKNPRTQKQHLTDYLEKIQGINPDDRLVIFRNIINHPKMDTQGLLDVHSNLEKIFPDRVLHHISKEFLKFGNITPDFFLKLKPRHKFDIESIVGNEEFLSSVEPKHFDKVMAKFDEHGYQQQFIKNIMHKKIWDNLPEKTVSKIIGSGAKLGSAIFNLKNLSKKHISNMIDSPEVRQELAQNILSPQKMLDHPNYTQKHHDKWVEELLKYPMSYKPNPNTPFFPIISSSEQKVILDPRTKKEHLSKILTGNPVWLGRMMQEQPQFIHGVLSHKNVDPEDCHKFLGLRGSAGLDSIQRKNFVGPAVKSLIKHNHPSLEQHLERFGLKDIKHLLPKATAEDYGVMKKSLVGQLLFKTEDLNKAMVLHPSLKSLFHPSASQREAFFSPENSIDESAISHGLKDPVRSVQVAAIKHRDATPKNINEALSITGDWVVPAWAAKHRNASHENIMKAIDHPSPEIKDLVSKREDLSPEHIDKFIQEADGSHSMGPAERLRSALKNNQKKISSDNVASVIKMPSVFSNALRQIAIMSPNAKKEHFDYVLEHPESSNETKAKAIKFHPEPTSKQLFDALKSGEFDLRDGAITNKNCTPEHLQYAAENLSKNHFPEIISHPNVTSDLISKAISRYFLSYPRGPITPTIDSAVKNPKTSSEDLSEILDKVVMKKDFEILNSSDAEGIRSVVRRIFGRKEVKSPTGLVLEQALHPHPNLKPEHFDQILSHPSLTVLNWALKSPFSTKDHVQKLLDTNRITKDQADDYLKFQQERDSQKSQPLNKSELKKAVLLHPETKNLFGNVDQRIHFFRDDNPSVDAASISHALKDPDSRVRFVAISHKNATPEHLNQALDHDIFRENPTHHLSVAMSAAEHPNASHENIMKAIEHPHEHVRSCVSQRRDLSPAHIDKIIQTGDRNTIYQALISNQNASRDSISQVVRSHSPSVVKKALLQTNATPEHFDSVLNSEFSPPDLKGFALQHHPNPRSEDLMAALDAGDFEIKNGAILNKNCTPEHLKKAIELPHLLDRALVHRAVSHPNITPELILYAMKKHKDSRKIFLMAAENDKTNAEGLTEVLNHFARSPMRGDYADYADRRAIEYIFGDRNGRHHPNLKPEHIDWALDNPGLWVDKALWSPVATEAHIQKALDKGLINENEAARMTQYKRTPF